MHSVVPGVQSILPEGACSSSAQPIPGHTSVQLSVLARCTLRQGSVRTWATGNEAQHLAGRNQS